MTVAAPKIVSRKKQKANMEMELFSSIKTLSDSINSCRPPRPPASNVLAPTPFATASQILNDFQMDSVDRVKLKMYWCEFPLFAQLFIDISASERLDYIELQLKKL